MMKKIVLTIELLCLAPIITAFADWYSWLWTGMTLTSIQWSDPSRIFTLIFFTGVSLFFMRPLVEELEDFGDN